MGEKEPIGLFLVPVGALKFDFGALLLFGLLFEILATTLGDSRRLFVGTNFCPNLTKPVDSSACYAKLLQNIDIIQRDHTTSRLRYD